MEVVNCVSAGPHDTISLMLRCLLPLQQTNWLMSSFSAGSGLLLILHVYIWFLPGPSEGHCQPHSLHHVTQQWQHGLWVFPDLVSPSLIVLNYCWAKTQLGITTFTSFSLADVWLSWVVHAGCILEMKRFLFSADCNNNCKSWKATKPLFLLQSPFFTCIITMAQPRTTVRLTGQDPDWTWTPTAQPKRTSLCFEKHITYFSLCFSAKNSAYDLFHCVRFNEDLLLVFSPLGFATHFLEVIKENEENDIMWWAAEAWRCWEIDSMCWAQHISKRNPIFWLTWSLK